MLSFRTPSGVRNLLTDNRKQISRFARNDNLLRAAAKTGEDARPPSMLPRFVPDNFDAFIEHVKGDVSFIFGDHERRREANSARSTAQEQNAALECELDDPVALWPGIFFRLLVFDDLHADHQPAAANVTNQAVLLWPVGDPLHDVIANVCRVLQQAFVLDYLERRHPSCNT